MNLDSVSKLKVGTLTSTPKGPQRTILKMVRILPRTVETSESVSSDEQPLYTNASQLKKQPNLAASSSWSRTPEGRENLEPARSSILNPRKRIVDPTISSESSGALPESPVKTNPVPVEIVPAKENPAKMDSFPTSSKTTQAEEPRVPESTKTKPSMKIEQLD